MSVTLNDVAKRAGVSAKTVSRVVNQQGEVSPETRLRILALIEEMGYLPNLLARGLVSQRSYSLAIVSWTLNRYAPAQFVMGVEKEADERGYAILLTITHPAEDKPLEAFLNRLTATQVDGILWHAPRVGSNQDWMTSERLSSLPPMVLNGLPNPALTTVSIDNHFGAQIATQHLIEQGWQRIGLICGNPDFAMYAERRRGWEEALRQAGQQPNPQRIVYGDGSAESGYQAMQELLRRQPDLDAVFVSDDTAALGALQSAQENGRAVGVDFGMVGYDGQPDTRYYAPPLTTVDQPIFNLGRKAVELLVAEIEARARGEAQGEPKLHLVQPELVIRESSLRSELAGSGDGSGARRVVIHPTRSGK